MNINHLGLSLPLLTLVELHVSVVVALHLPNQTLPGLFVLLRLEFVLAVDYVELLLYHSKLILLASVVIATLFQLSIFLFKLPGLLIYPILD
jgi:hypothetical protein